MTSIVGVSLDGPASLHDAIAAPARGLPSHRRSLRGIRWALMQARHPPSR